LEERWFRRGGAEEGGLATAMLMREMALQHIDLPV